MIASHRVLTAVFLALGLAACAHQELPPRAPSAEQEAAATALRNTGSCAPSDVVVRNLYGNKNGWVQWDGECRAPTMPRVRCRVEERTNTAECVPVKQDSP